MVHGTNSAAEYVELDQAGGVTTAPLFVADRFTVRALAHGPQRFAIGYEALDFAPTVRTGTAALANQPHALGVPEMIVADVVPVGDGFALAWIEDDGTESAHGELRFTGVDADGVPVTPIVRVTDHSATASVAAIDQNTFAVAFDTFGTPMLAVFDAP